ncbi:MAG: GNAT family N-acetyltransferase [Nisaea sp.]|uniref:GNAT family N-acetyltransferase n=1 Tax=Nisaea sp. TaxID=2024842 RepID=UPI001B1D6508|nr:GNAT family N-acetyltransferase [Nisaea sp.]MBO6560804.1 GNAT family N-acetyltransferase [Nisaea sp.]
MTELTFNVIDGQTDGLYEIDQRLVAFNRERSDWNSRYFTVEIRDADGKLRGGAGARVNLGIVEVSTIWLDNDLRGNGWGRRLVETVVEKGRDLQAGKIMLDTYDFQARAFYEALGFSVFGTLDYPSGNSRFYLSRDI